MSETIRVVTTPMINGTIVEEVQVNTEDIYNTILRSVLDTGEQQIQDALVVLGWLPPAERDALRAEVERLRATLHELAHDFREKARGAACNECHDSYISEAAYDDCADTVENKIKQLARIVVDEREEG